jgi:hypothetical protein
MQLNTSHEYGAHHEANRRRWSAAHLPIGYAWQSRSRP